MRLPAACLTVLALTACGEDASFLDKSSKASRSSGANLDSTDPNAPTDPSTAGDLDGADAGGAGAAGAADGDPANADGGDAGDGGNDGGNDGDGDATAETPPDIPAANPSDLPALHKCLAQWKDHPFQGTVQNFRRINAAITVGGFGNAINDTEETAGPFLVLIDAGVNVLGAPTYNLLNPNGFYCMKVNVNVMTALTVNLHCTARLADDRVNVNVLSSQNDQTSAVGVHVLSDVQVRTVRPEGDSCIR